MREQIVTALTGHDFILALGAPVFTYHIEGFGPHIPPEAELFQLIDDPDLAAWTPVGNAVVGDVTLGVEMLLRGPSPSSRPPASGRVRPERVTPDADTISIPFLMQTLAEVRPPDSILVEESPSSRRAMQAHLPIERPRSFFTCASGGLGYSLPAAVGMALGTTDGRRVIGLFGDGSAMYSIQSLWSAADLKLPLTVVIVNNGGYAALKEFSSHFNVRQLVGTQLPGIDFPGLARSLGCGAARVERPGELAAALERALRASGPCLVDVAVA
jgi:benzoylformate decarboxylase